MYCILKSRALQRTHWILWLPPCGTQLMVLANPFSWPYKGYAVSFHPTVVFMQTCCSKNTNYLLCFTTSVLASLNKSKATDLLQLLNTLLFMATNLRNHPKSSNHVFPVYWLNWEVGLVGDSYHPVDVSLSLHWSIPDFCIASGTPNSWYDLWSHIL
jgi:hypothetical protein